MGQYGKLVRCFSISYFSKTCPVFKETTGVVRGFCVRLQTLRVAIFKRVGYYYTYKLNRREKSTNLHNNRPNNLSVVHYWNHLHLLKADLPCHSSHNPQLYLLILVALNHRFSQFKDIPSQKKFLFMQRSFGRQKIMSMQEVSFAQIGGTCDKLLRVCQVKVMRFCFFLGFFKRLMMLVMSKLRGIISISNFLRGLCTSNFFGDKICFFLGLSNIIDRKNLGEVRGESFEFYIMKPVHDDPFFFYLTMHLHDFPMLLILLLILMHIYRTTRIQQSRAQPKILFLSLEIYQIVLLQSFRILERIFLRGSLISSLTSTLLRTHHQIEIIQSRGICNMISRAAAVFYF